MGTDGEAARRGIEQRSDLQGWGVIAPVDGTRWLTELLCVDRFQTIVLPVHLETMPARLREQALFKDLVVKQSVAVQQASDDRDALAQVPPALRLSWLTNQVSEKLAKVLGMESGSAIASTASFNDLGLDSLTGIEFIDGLNRQWNVKLPSSAVYDYPSIRGFSEFLWKHLAPDFALNEEDELLSAGTNEQEFDAVVEPATALDAEPISDTSSVQAIDVDLESGLSQLLAELRQWKT